MRINCKNITNKTYGRLTVINPNIANGKYYYALCVCECGNIKTVRRDHLVSGRIQSCGCLQRENGSRLGKEMCKKIAGANRIDITGKRFGTLTAIKMVKEGNLTHMEEWLCKCDCGATQIVNKGNLLAGHTKSCGCKTSSLERITANILKKHGINFVKNKTFDSCRLSNGGRAKFDFYVENNYIIECDGIQHFEKGFYNPLGVLAEKDRLKNEWCFENNIPIIRIPYTHKDNITISDLKPESSSFLLGKGGKK